MKQRKRAHRSQIVGAKETSSWVTVVSTKDRYQIKALRQGHYRVRRLTPPPPPPAHRAIKEKTIAINHDWVYNLICRLSHDILVISKFFITFYYLLNWARNISIKKWEINYCEIKIISLIIIFWWDCAFSNGEIQVQQGDSVSKKSTQLLTW